MYAAKRFEYTRELFKYAGIGDRRLYLEWVSAAEGQRFAEIITEITEKVRQVGPFAVDRHRLRLDALIETLKSQSARWIMGIERQLTEHGNVYGETLDAGQYRRFAIEKLRFEYEKTLVRLTLQQEALSVREVAAKVEMDVSHVANLVVDLHGRGRVRMAGHDGTKTKFIAAG